MSVRLFNGQVYDLSANRSTGGDLTGQSGESTSPVIEAAHNIVYGATASGGYTWTNDASAEQLGTDAGFGAPTVSGYVGLVGSTRRVGYVIQYAPTVTSRPYNGERAAIDAVHVLSSTFRGALSRRLNWNLSLDGSYGSQFARFASPQVVGSVSPATSPDARSSLITNFGMKQAQAAVGVGLEWQKSRTQMLRVSASGSYFAALAQGESAGDHEMSGSLSVAFAQSVSRNISVNPYATVTRLFSFPACTTYGGGVEINVVTQRSIEINVGAGPQGASKGCGSPSYNAHARISSPLRPTSALYISADRQFSTVFGEKGRWSDSIGVGVSKALRQTTMKMDAGYVRAENGVASSATQGYFFAGSCSRQLSRTISVGIDFRQEQFVSPVGGMARAVGVFVSWYPRAVPF